MQRTFHNDSNSVFNACKKALNQLEMTLEYNDKDSGRISASTSTSIFSWGETIDILIISQTVTSTVVKVTSSSNAQLIDWGKNETNETNILNKIAEILR